MCKYMSLCIVSTHVRMHMKHIAHMPSGSLGHGELQGKSEGVTTPFSSPGESNLPVICKTQGRAQGCPRRILGMNH